MSIKQDFAELRNDVGFIKATLTVLAESFTANRPATTTQTYPLSDLMDKHYYNQATAGKGRKGKPLTRGTLQCYQTYRVYVENFLKETDRELADTSDVNARFMSELQSHFSGKLQGITIHQTVSYVKQVVRFGVLYEYCAAPTGLLFKNPTNQDANPKPLTADEITKLETTIFPYRIQRTVDCFLFLRYTGFHYKDGSLLTDTNQHLTENGLLILQTARKKTGNTATVPFHTKARLIVERYGGLGQLPFASNNTMNRQLKLAAKQINIRPDLVVSMARDTFADDQTNNKLVSDETLAAMLGHADTQTVKKYRRVSIRRIVQEWKE